MNDPSVKNAYEGIREACSELMRVLYDDSIDRCVLVMEAGKVTEAVGNYLGRLQDAEYKKNKLSGKSVEEVTFTDNELVYAAVDKCPCGAGLAYPKKCMALGTNYWDCSDILKGSAKSVQHTAQLPFAFYEVKSEGQPSANGATTRPVAMNK